MQAFDETQQSDTIPTDTTPIVPTEATPIAAADVVPSTIAEAPPSPATVGQLRDVFLTFIKVQGEQGRCTRSTCRYYRHALNRWIASVGADVPIADVQAAHLAGFPPTSNVISAVKRLFVFACQHSIVAASPFTQIFRLRRKRQDAALAAAPSTNGAAS